MQEFLTPGRFIDSDAHAVIDFARSATADADGEMERVLRLYRTVRDGIIYDPYVDFMDPANFQASAVIERGRGFCVGKAALLAACARVVGIPARVGYADVRNHLTSPKLYERVKSDVFIWHSYADLRIDGVWVKATPAFNLALCRKIGIEPLDFDGKSDSLFHAFDPQGRRHMEYLKDRGTFADVPFETIRAEFREYYPQLRDSGAISGDFQSEAVAAIGEEMAPRSN